ncbi:hypothetical protein [Candidatus Accumulibacter contiguus]|uniref:hypothetical protein n=1 Tax=Candidatus Accumulibacter contiguus TaxID=2954381 RepID=UPI001B7EA170|nr:hypothetical protein [Candidatus Accumulibacter contiguus]
MARSSGAESVRSEMLAHDGKRIPLEIRSQVVQLGQGRKVVQGVFRPLDSDDA